MKKAEPIDPAFICVYYLGILYHLFSDTCHAD